MALVLVAFMLWLFATGKAGDWISLATKPATQSPQQTAEAATGATKTGFPEIDNLGGASGAILP